jgi:hypothetical protein
MKGFTDEVLVIGIIILIILFAGDPNLMDAIIKLISK